MQGNRASVSRIVKRLGRFLGSLTSGFLGGWLYGFYMAEFYWQNEGKTRANTYLYYEAIGCVVGIVLGALLVFWTCTKPGIRPLREEDDIQSGGLNRT